MQHGCRIELKFLLRAAEELESTAGCFGHFVNEQLTSFGIIFAPFLGDVRLPQERVEKEVIDAFMRLNVVLESRIINRILYFLERFLLELAVVGKLYDLIEECLLTVS